MIFYLFFLRYHTYPLFSDLLNHLFQYLAYLQSRKVAPILDIFYLGIKI